MPVSLFYEWNTWSLCSSDRAPGRTALAPQVVFEYLPALHLVTAQLLPRAGGASEEKNLLVELTPGDDGKDTPNEAHKLVEG